MHSYPGVSQPALNEFALQGMWNVNSEGATPVSSAGSIMAGFQAAHVYLVLTSSDNTPRQVRVLLDGKTVSARAAGTDVRNGLVTVQGQRLYSLVSLPGDQQHALTVVVPPGVKAYDFTFG